MRLDMSIRSENVKPVLKRLNAIYECKYSYIGWNWG